MSVDEEGKTRNRKAHNKITLSDIPSPLEMSIDRGDEFESKLKDINSATIDFTLRGNHIHYLKPIPEQISYPYESTDQKISSVPPMKPVSSKRPYLKRKKQLFDYSKVGMHLYNEDIASVQESSVS